MFPFCPRQALLILVSATFILLLGWAQLTTVHDVVHGEGRVVPQSKTQKVQHFEGGIVEAILVKEGQVVKKDEPLFRINALSANADADELDIKAMSLRARQQRLLAEQSATPLEFAEELSSNPRYQSIINTEKQLYQARKQEYQRDVDMVREQINQKRLTIIKLESQKDSLDKELAIAQRQLDINTRLFEKGAMSESQLLTAQSKVSQLQGEQIQAVDQIPVAQAEHKELTHRAEKLKAEYLAKVNDELSEVSVQVRQLDEKQKTAQDKLARTIITAPMDGIVNQLNVTTNDAVIQPGQVVAELTPTHGAILIEGRIRARDRGRIWNEQPVLVRVSAYDYTHYGALAGRVEDISADSLTNDQGNIFYRVKIKLDKTEFPDHSPVLAGMTVDFHIQAGQRTILQMLLAPIMEELWLSFAPTPSVKPI